LKKPDVIHADMVEDWKGEFKRTFRSDPVENFWAIFPPQYSVNMDQIERLVERLKIKYHFIPDLICIDYLDITAPEKENGLSERGQYDMKWRKAKGMAQRRKCCVATVTQTNRGAFTKENIDELDTAEDIRKLAAVDLIMTLNQTNREKKAGLMRIGVLNYRHDDADFTNRIWVLRDLKTGRPFLDSEYDVDNYRRVHGWVKPKEEKKDDDHGESRKRRRDIDD
jgi:hypothetical protein